MIYYYLGLIGFLVLWEIFYLIEKRHPDFMFGGCSFGEPTWLEHKVNALMSLLMCLIVLSLISIPVYIAINAGYGLELVFTIILIGLFFGINYLFRGRKSGKR